MFEPENFADQETVKGLREMPVRWFYWMLTAVALGWILSIAELVCLWRIGVLL